MRKLLTSALLFSLIASLSLVAGDKPIKAGDKDKTWIGFLTISCCRDSKTKPPAQHPRQCLLSCSSNPDRKVLLWIAEDNSFLVLDAKGRELAIAALKDSTVERGTAAKISGTLDGDVIKVATLNLVCSGHWTAAMKKANEDQAKSMEEAKKAEGK